MWSYSTNQMGVYGLWWYEQNNIPYTVVKGFSKLFSKPIEFKSYEHWYGGRIDCYCDNVNDIDYDRYGVELNLPIMDAKSYGQFSEWLNGIQTEHLVDFDTLLKMYETHTNQTVRLWIDGMYKEGE